MSYSFGPLADMAYLTRYKKSCLSEQHTDYHICIYKGSHSMTGNIRNFVFFIKLWKMSRGSSIPALISAPVPFTLGQIRVREIAQWLRVFSALADHPGLVPTMWETAPNHLWFQFLGFQCPFWPLHTPGAQQMHKNSLRLTLIHTK